MSVLLAIIAHPRDRERLIRHWPYFKLTGWPILGCGTVDGKVVWPEDVDRLDIGKMGTRNTPAGSSIFGLVEQEIDIWKYFLTQTNHDSVCVVEADNLFTQRPPEHPGNVYLITQLPNYEPPRLFKTKVYFSTPRWADRTTAERLHKYGSEMFKQGDVEHWISDRFPAWVCHKHNIPWKGQPAWSPSVFCQSDEQWIQDARTAIRRGCYCLHSVKHEWQLEAVMDLIRIRRGPLPCCA